MRVKNEFDWIEPSLQSIRAIADEIIAVDNGSTDGTYEYLEAEAARDREKIRLFRKPQMIFSELSDFALSRTSYRWVFKFDGDMVAHTSGDHTISNLRNRLISLDSRRFYVVYLRLINLSGDLFHQDPRQMVHIEEYVHTASSAARYIQAGRYEAIKFPRYYRVLFWYEPYIFHVDIKDSRRMLLRYFWEKWMKNADYKKFPSIDDFVNAYLPDTFGTSSWKEAQEILCSRSLSCHIPYDSGMFGPYPDLLKPYLEKPKYKLIYRDGKIIGRDEPEKTHP